ncbi:MAG TPA: serine O-acetyltransferase [Sedimentisphaerales bacterium]|nr:serine O-acetyltransferase [Sedimentisphaerales bacterium]
MTEHNLTSEKINNLVSNLVETYHDDSGINFIDTANLPVRGEIIAIVELLMELLFPGYTGRKEITKSNLNFVVGDLLHTVYSRLACQIEKANRHLCRMKACPGCDCAELADEVTVYLLEKLGDIRQMLKGDVKAAYDGDPAVRSYEEVVISYPCIVALATHRIAHELYLKGVPLIPRIMSEYAHTRTGIDIHPGATIGKNFFIDHGTGVVIGETSIIGDNVKIYQGATLGALSFPKDERGNIIKGGKRHPTICDNVTIYAEATILGDIVIGKDAVIGGNVWIKESVPEGVMVTTSNPDLVYKKRKDKK